MTADTIYHLSKCLPSGAGTSIWPVNNFDVQEGEIAMDRETADFLHNYKNLRFGWDFAVKVGRLRLPIPEILSPKEDWLYRACLYHRDPAKYADRGVQGAIAMASPAMRNTRDLVNALLVADDMTTRAAAEQLGLPHEQIDAYEQLFFNIIDRKADREFVRCIVYPDSRLVELMTHYLKNEPLGKLLMRMGYNNGAEEVLHFAGLKSDATRRMAGTDVPVKLESAFMAQAYLLVRNGFINQPIPAIRDAKNLIAAAKQGSGNNSVTSPFHGQVGNMFRSELLRAPLREPVKAPANNAKS